MFNPEKINLGEIVSDVEKKVEEETKKRELAQEQKKTTKKQKEIEAKNEILPLKIELRKTELKEIFNYGGQLYSSLLKNLEGFAQWLKEGIDIGIEKDNIFSEMNKKYKEITGEYLNPQEASLRKVSKEDMYKMYYLVKPDFESQIPQEKDAWGKAIRKNKIEEMKREYMIKRANTLDKEMENVLGRIGRYTFVSPERVPKTPEELIRAIINSREQEAPTYKYNQKEWIENHNSLLLGLGIAALESGDIEVAAIALANSQAEEVSLEISERLRQGLNRLESDKQLEFVQMFRSLQKESEKKE